MTQLLHPVLRQVGLEVPAGLPDGELAGISCDSRRVEPGSLFVGLPGTQVDGGRFWPQALRAGAVAAVISPEAAAAQPPGPGDAVLVAADPLARWAGLLAAAFWCQPSQRLSLIGVTGTNGKTTTTLLIYHLLKQAGLNVGLAGNIGRSLARQVAQEQFDYYVVEMSSFQLDRIDTYRSHIAILCNITPDHLDRYEYNVEAYADAKMRITRNQEASEYFIYCADDSLTQEAMLRNPFLAKAIPFSLQTTLTEGAYGKDNILHILTKETFTLDMQEFTLRGQHNAYNSMAASVAASLMDVRKDSIRESFTNFQNAEHRLEFVQKVGGIDYINDSKATNVNSAWYALESMDRPVIWIAGGVDKGNNYADLKNLVKSKVKMIICLGLDNIKIHQAFQADVDLIINTSSAKEAVHVASKMADQGDVVLLSPACASFDLFDSYEDRGRQFKEAVRHL